MKKWILGITVSLALLVVLGWTTLWLMERGYQMNMDPIRRQHARQIASLVQEFAEKTGSLPFQEEATETPFMVFIGRSAEEEDRFANDPVMKRNAVWANSSELEAVLSEGLGRTVRLPRDPQSVPTYAPNVYVYFVAGKQFTVVSHLKYSDPDAVEYRWRGRPFYAYTVCYENGFVVAAE
jgi:hypothetical protein